MTVARTACLCLAMFLVAACAGSRGSYTSGDAPQRDIKAAEALYRKAVAQLPKDQPAAEALLRQCLDHDLYHGPAHNNLGVLLLRQERLYEAAEEFEWAKKLLPGNPEPRVNLAIALERGGCFAQAAEAAHAALEVRPGNLPATEMLARIQIRDDKPDETTLANLDAIVMRSTDPAWRQWATLQRDRLRARSPQD